MRRIFLLSIVACSLAFQTPARGQESAGQRFAMATNQLRRAAIELSVRCLAEVRALEDWRGRRPEMRRALLEMLGLGSPPPRGPLRARVTGTIGRDLYRIEKIVFQSAPGLYVTANFYVPHGKEPFPTVLYLCGHAPHPQGAKVSYQDRAAWFAAHGFACLIVDTLEFGEVPGIHHGLHDLNLWHWLSLGYTPAGVEVWNAIRAVDYLETRPEVARDKIGVTGISGGGASTWFTAAVDERVQAAVPVCSTYTFGSQAEHWRAFGQCDCIYFHNTFQLDFPIVAALIAPRPLLMISGRLDADFPPDGYRRVYEQARRIYGFYGADDRVREFDDDVGHSDPPQFLREARQWMEQWLKAQPARVALETNRPPAESARDLACLDALPGDAINDRIQDILTAPVKIAAPRSRRAWEKRRAELLRGLDEKVFRWFPSAPPPFETRVSRNEGGWANHYADYREASFQVEAGARVRAQLLTPKGGGKETALLVYVKRPGDSIYAMDLDELLPVLGRQTVLILNPRFTEGTISPEELRDLQMTAAWSGRTVAGMQVWDVQRAIRWALEDRQLDPAAISLYGKGEMGIVALYAALREPRVSRVILNRAPGTHRDGPALLNVLRVTDIAEAAGALAPRQIVSLTPLPDSFGTTRRIFEIEKAASRLGQAGSLGQALELGKN